MIFGRPFIKQFALCYQTVVCPDYVPVCLSVALVYCGQTVECIKIKLGVKVDLVPGHIVLDRDPAGPPLQQGHNPQFSAHVCCGQRAG